MIATHTNRTSWRGRILLALGLGLLAPAAARAQVDGEIEFNEKFLGIVSTGADQDVVQFDEVAGSTLKVVVKRQGKNSLAPLVQLLDDSMSVLATGDGDGGKTDKIKGFVTPYTGTYFVRVSSGNGLTGTYRVTVKGKPPAAVTAGGTVAAPGALVEIPFVARAGSRLDGKITSADGIFEPLLVEIESPSGLLVNVAGVTKSKQDGAVLKVKKLFLPADGTYLMRLTGGAGTTGSFASDLRIEPPAPLKGKVFEDEHPKQPGSSGGFTLKEVFFGRGLEQPDGSLQVVSPFSTVRTDPISGVPVPGTLTPLFAGIPLDQLVPFEVGPTYVPPVVPRNAVLELTFTAGVDAESLKLDAGGRLTEQSPIRIEVNDDFVAVEATVDGKRVLLDPVFDEQIGFPASPLAVNALGGPVASTTGSGTITIFGDGGAEPPLLSTSGKVYQPHKTLLGSPTSVGGMPLGFNPGNQILDFIQQSSAGLAQQSFGGFLPDDAAPRLIRAFTFADTFEPNYADPALGDSYGVDTFTVITDEPFDVAAKQGNGEWANGILRLRPAGPATEEHLIVGHTALDLGTGQFANTFLLASPILTPPGVGEAFELQRAEYFEPDPSNPIEFALFDPLNPENANNADLRNFVVITDPEGNPQDPTGPIDPSSIFRFRFSEPMAPESFRPYESLFVANDPSSGNFGINFVARVTLEEGGRVARYAPERVIQFGPQAGTVENIGLGGTPNALRLHLVSVPRPEVIEALLGATAANEYLKEGHLGVTDLGGQPLAFPTSMLEPSDPEVDYSLPFTTTGDASLPEVGAIVHRFLGQPSSGFTANGDTGATYRDVPTSLTDVPSTPVVESNVYGPRLADINLFTNGFLSGAPVQFLQKIFDDFNPPLPDDELTPAIFPVGTPFGGFAPLGGVRFQHVYRAVDASPDWQALQGTLLDLYQVAWAPFDGFIDPTVLPDVSVHAGHSAVVPDTAQGAGVPNHELSGLVSDMNANYNAQPLEGGDALPRQLLHGTETAPNTFQGKPYQLDPANLFTPPGTSHQYHPLPNGWFDHPFQYDNGAPDFKLLAGLPEYGVGDLSWLKKTDHRPHSLLLEYRVRAESNDPSPPALGNGFTFSIGILSSALPRFRVYSMGVGCMACCFPVGCNALNGCATAFGPALDGTMNGGGPPIDPDLIVTAAGPAPSPPGLACYCLKPPQNPLPPPASPPAPQPCADNIPATDPTIDKVATGQAANPPPTFNTGNNFGDNSRYLMVFNYVKRESLVRSPFVRAQPTTVADPTFLTPIFEPSLDSLPAGTELNVRFRSSADGLLEFTPWVTPEEMANPNNPLNTHANAGPYLQFEVQFIGDTTTQLVPALEEIVIPFEH